MLRKILFANKGSSAGDRALLYIEHLAHQEEAEVVVVHAFEVPNRYASADALRAAPICEELARDLAEAVRAAPRSGA